MREIILTQGKVALIDDEDFERVSKYKWYAAKDHHRDKFYAVRSERSPNRHQLYMHRFILGITDPKIKVDHKGSTLDNRKEMIRACSNSENMWNRIGQNSNNTSSYRGVYFFKRDNKWIAQITVNRKNIYLGIHSTPEEAAHAFDEAAKEYFGNFSGKLNFGDKDE